MNNSCMKLVVSTCSLNKTDMRRLCCILPYIPLEPPYDLTSQSIQYSCIGKSSLGTRGPVWEPLEFLELAALSKSCCQSRTGTHQKKAEERWETVRAERDGNTKKATNHHFRHCEKVVQSWWDSWAAIWSYGIDVSKRSSRNQLFEQGKLCVFQIPSDLKGLLKVHIPKNS